MTRPEVITDRLIEDVTTRLRTGERVRRGLPEWGRVHIDRQLPFLCVYRRPAKREDLETERFVVGEASYLLGSGNRKHSANLCRLARGVAGTLATEFGAFLIVEVWSDGDDEDTGGLPTPPRFRIHVPPKSELQSTVGILEKSLARIKIQKQSAVVEVVPGAPDHAPGFTPLVRRREALELAVHWLGVSVRPIWRRSGQFFPLLRRTLSRRFSRALQQAIFEFTGEKTTHRPKHFHALGKRAMVKAVWEVDRQLAGVDDSFDFLLQVTPVNAAPAFREFERAGFSGRPSFLYRPMPVDPALLKRRLYDIRIERVEDPTLATLFREKRRELDIQINTMLERGSRRALYNSLQLFGEVDDDLLGTAKQLLEKIPARSREGTADGVVEADEFAERAQAEMDHYRRREPAFASRVTIEDNLIGMMVSKGDLLIGRQTRVAASRVEALLQHEVGTHVVTYHNGRAQRFQQLHCGLAGYEELQEGLAVLAEYLVGGLSRPRLRLLAARVVAARALTDGAEFDDTFALLNGIFGFDRKTAFTVTMRIYRAGGLTKDAVYLRGLIGVLEYLRQGGELDTLFVGKIAAEHVPVIRELQRRRILYTPALRPRFLDHPAAARNLQRVRDGLSVLELAKGGKK